MTLIGPPDVNSVPFISIFRGGAVYFCCNTMLETIKHLVFASLLAFFMWCAIYMVTQLLSKNGVIRDANVVTNPAAKHDRLIDVNQTIGLLNDKIFNLRGPLLDFVLAGDTEVVVVNIHKMAEFVMAELNDTHDWYYYKYVRRANVVAFVDCPAKEDIFPINTMDRLWLLYQFISLPGIDGVYMGCSLYSSRTTADDLWRDDVSARQDGFDIPRFSGPTTPQVADIERLLDTIRRTGSTAAISGTVTIGIHWPKVCKKQVNLELSRHTIVEGPVRHNTMDEGDGCKYSSGRRCLFFMCAP